MRTSPHSLSQQLGLAAATLGMLGAMVLGMASPADAAQCRGLGPADTYLMPPARYWGLVPAGRVHAMGCAELTEFRGVLRGLGGKALAAEATDCLVAGVWVPSLSTMPDEARAFAWLALHGNGLPEAGGVMIVCTGLDRTSRQMTIVHERAHAEGWEHAHRGSRWLTTRQWRAAFDAWMNTRGRK